MRFLSIACLLVGLLHACLAQAMEPSAFIDFSMDPAEKPRKGPGLKWIIPGTRFTYEQALRPLFPHFSITSAARDERIVFGEHGPFPPLPGTPLTAQDTSDPLPGRFGNESHHAPVYRGLSMTVRHNGKIHLLWLIEQVQNLHVRPIKYHVMALVALEDPAPRLLDARSVPADREAWIDQLVPIGDSHVIVFSAWHYQSNQKPLFYQLIGIEQDGRLRRWYASPRLIQQKKGAVRHFTFDNTKEVFLPHPGLHFLPDMDFRLLKVRYKCPQQTGRTMLAGYLPELRLQLAWHASNQAYQLHPSSRKMQDFLDRCSAP